MKRKTKMKKMMTLLAVVLAAGITQAAAISWNSGTMYMPTSAADGTWNTAGGSAYRVPGGAASPVTAYFFILSAEDYAAVNIDTISAQMKAGTYNLDGADNTAKPTAGPRAANWTNQGNYAPETSGYMLAIYTLDATDASFGQEWFMVAIATGTIPQSGADVTVQNMASNIGEWTPVPEPTSMALLALGVAALGLRRKFRA
jgi:hypothetical protein